jgi:hypothetical protein
VAFSINSCFLNQLAIRPTYLPAQWSDLVHPEGKIYFHWNSGLRVVSESYLYNSVTAENISAWVLEIEEQASEKGFAFTDHTELFLQLDGIDCNYYFVDHGVRMLFWLDAYDSSELGILPVVSSSHLSKPNLFGLFRGILILYLTRVEALLEAQYWTHIENFCMHIDGLPLKTIDDLIDTFSHALLGRQILIWRIIFKLTTPN